MDVDVEKLLPLKDRAQIISAIERGADFGGEIWQNGVSGRKILRIYKIYIDMKKDRFVLRTFGLADVDPRLPVFIRLAYRNVLFKLDTDEFDLAGDRLACNWLKAARALEVRVGLSLDAPLGEELFENLKKKSNFVLTA